MSFDVFFAAFRAYAVDDERQEEEIELRWELTAGHDSDVT